jgi:adenylosuccinate synthase
VVVRFNGGAQAGHTVVTPGGRRHVFSHVGSGAFTGAATFLSRFFVANPILYRRELAALAGFGVTPRVSIDPRAPVTTPWDMMINQAVESARGSARHGSCGIGFGETIERNLDPAAALTAGDLLDRDRLAVTLQTIRSDYLPRRLAVLGLSGRAPALDGLAMSDDLLANYLADVEAFLAAVAIDRDGFARARAVVFEGAQGLMLDQDRGAFPHVTRSSTGLRNVLALAQEAGIGELDVTYATRAYVTRHGAGPLAHELDGLPAPGVHDATNMPNAWQGSLRFGWLDLDVLGRAIAADLSDVPATVTVRHALAMTCVDQMGAHVTWAEGARLRTGTPDALLSAAAVTAGTPRLLAGTGPTRRHVMPMPAGRKRAA